MLLSVQAIEPIQIPQVGLETNSEFKKLLEWLIKTDSPSNEKEISRKVWRLMPQSLRCISFDSYIKPQLCLVSRKLDACCISFDSYIKPQRLADVRPLRHGCISFDSYIKPQHCSNTPIVSNVVYLLIPTSNHNMQPARLSSRTVVYLLIPTSNHNF